MKCGTSNQGTLLTFGDRRDSLNSMDIDLAKLFKNKTIRGICSGMTKESVIKQLGTPDDMYGEKGFEYLVYGQLRLSFMSFELAAISLLRYDYDTKLFWKSQSYVLPDEECFISKSSSLEKVIFFLSDNALTWSISSTRCLLETMIIEVEETCEIVYDLDESEIIEIAIAG